MDIKIEADLGIQEVVIGHEYDVSLLLQGSSQIVRTDPGKQQRQGQAQQGSGVKRSREAGLSAAGRRG